MDEIILVIIMLGIVAGAAKGYIALTPEVEVFVDDKLIFKGPDACVNISSGGYTTTVKVSKGFFCSVPDKSYTSKDVVVKPAE